MKKILTFLFLLVACFAFVSCKNPDDAKIKQIDEVMNQLFQDTDLSNVSTDLNFVTTISGVKLTYHSSDEDVLTNEGKVTPSESSKTVTLEVTFELDGYKKNKEYTITIASLPTPSYMSISKVKTLEKDTEVTIRGIVSRIINGTEKNVPVGFYVFDKTDAIYIYSSSVAETVMFGEEVIVKGTYTMYIDETSMTAAEMVGYTGARQIVASSVEVITSGNALPTSGVKQSSIEELALTSVSENITSNVYEVTATIKKVPGNGFVNYYFNDLNGINSFYAYTTANGKDLSWLEKYDGQTRKCMIAVQNCKISASGSFWRIVPLEIHEEVTVTDQELTAYALKRVLREFSSKYSASCSLELLTKDEILTTSSVTYEVISGPITLDGNILKITCTSTLQKASIKVTITYNDVVLSEVVEFDCVEEIPEIETIDICDAREKQKGDVVTIKGIIVGFLYLSGSKTPAGFELIDETGSIAVFISTAVDRVTDITKLSKGEFVYVTGSYDLYQPRLDNNHNGSIRLNNAEVLYHDYQEHEIPSSYIESKDLKDLIQNPSNNNITNIVYKTKLYLEKSNGSYKNYYIHDLDDPSLSMIVYSQNSGSNGVPEYSWLDEYDNKCVEAYVTLRIGAVSNKKFVWKSAVLEVLRVIDTPYSVLNYQAKNVITSAFSKEYTKASEVTFELEQGDVQIKSSTLDGVTISKEARTFTVSIPEPIVSMDVTLTISYKTDKSETIINVTFKVTKLESMTVADARDKAKKNGETVSLEGVVVGITRSEGANTWGFYLADESGIIFVKEPSTVVVGDKVKVTGSLDLYYGMPQIAKGATIEIISNDNPLPDGAFKENATIKDLADANTSGEAAKLGAVGWKDIIVTIYVSESKVYITDGEHEATMYYYANSKYYAYNYKNLESLNGKKVKLSVISYNVYNNEYTFVITSIEELKVLS